MRGRAYLFVALFLLPFGHLAAQSLISGTLTSAKGRQLTLYSYTGQAKLPIDSTKADSQGGFGFDKYLETGMYTIENGNVSIELLYDGHRIQFMEYAPDNIRFYDSPINERWTAYLTKRQEFRHNSEVLKQVLRQYDPQSAFYANANSEFVTLQRGFGAFCDSLTLTDDYASRLIKADRPIMIDPNASVDQQRDFVMLHFFDDVDFNDTTLIPTNVLTTKMIDYISVVQADTRLSSSVEMRMILALNNIFERAKCNFTTYSFVLQYMLSGYSAIGLTTVTDYLLSYPALREGDITQEQGRRLDAIAEPYQKVRVGEKAPDIIHNTIDGQKVDLYSLDSDWVVVLFWSVDCPYCHDLMNKMRKKMNLDEYRLVTFAIANDADEVRIDLTKMNLKGLHIYDDARWEADVVKAYNVFSTPTVFVLDKDRTIVCKPNDWNELQAWLKKSKK